jgi:hypothetical protein
VPGSGYSQSSIGWNTGSPVEKLEKAPNGAEGVCNPIVEQQYELTNMSRAHICSCICNRRWPSWQSQGREAPWYCKLYMPHYRGMPGLRSGGGWVGEQDRGRL